MPKTLTKRAHTVTFWREGRVEFTGSVTVNVPSDVEDDSLDDYVRNEAETLLMRGMVDFSPLLHDVKFGDAAVIVDIAPNQPSA